MPDEELLRKLRNDPEGGMKQVIDQYASLVWAVVKGRLAIPPFCAADVEAAVEKRDPAYRITFHHCACDTPLGSNRTDTAEMKEFEKLLLDLQTVRGIKHIWLSKNWWKEVNTKTETVHIADTDPPYFLANIQDNCLYKIELYPRYY